METGKFYLFKVDKARYPNGPDQFKAKLLEISDEDYKVQINGRIVTWKRIFIKSAVEVQAGGKRKTRKGSRKGSRKSHRKAHRKSRRTCRK